MSQENSIQEEGKQASEALPTCGIIMPISGDGIYSKEHWLEVRKILHEVAEGAKFKPKLVSIADEVKVIHSTIINNIIENPIVICDVSSKNANVMFELGLRLAFDMATILIKDDITGYNFDTSPIEHLTYPKSLHYHSINEFKKELKEKLLATYNVSLKDGYSPFLKEFIRYKPKIEEKEVGLVDFLTRKFDNIESRINSLDQKQKPIGEFIDLPITNRDEYNAKHMQKYILNEAQKVYINLIKDRGNYDFNYFKEVVKEYITENNLVIKTLSSFDKLVDLMYNLVVSFYREDKDRGNN